jgi:hypothetical protein
MILGIIPPWYKIGEKIQQDRYIGPYYCNGKLIEQVNRYYDT